MESGEIKKYQNFCYNYLYEMQLITNKYFATLGKHKKSNNLNQYALFFMKLVDKTSVKNK